MPPLMVPPAVKREPCPFCHGMGMRAAVIPPPLPKGGRQRRLVDPHGHGSTYTRGCRCELCRLAWRVLQNGGNRRRRQVAP